MGKNRALMAANERLFYAGIQGAKNELYSWASTYMSKRWYVMLRDFLVQSIEPIQAIFNLHGEMCFALATQPTPLQNRPIGGTKICLKWYSSYS